MIDISKMEAENKKSIKLQKKKKMLIYIFGQLYSFIFSPP